MRIFRNLQTKLIVGMATVLLLHALFLVALLERTSARQLEDRYASTMRESVVKTRQLVDKELETIVAGAKKLNVDTDLYLLITNMATRANVDAHEKYNELDDRYFGDIQSIFRTNLTAPYFYSINKNLYYPYERFMASSLYHKSLEKRPYEHWAPTHRLTSEAQLMWGLPQKQLGNLNVFTYVRRINSIIVLDKQIVRIPLDIPNPYLIVDIRADLFDEYFSSSLLTPNSQFVVTTAAGELIAASDGAIASGDGDIYPWLADPPGSFPEENFALLRLPIGGEEHLVVMSASEVNGFVMALLMPLGDLRLPLTERIGMPLILSLIVSFGLIILVALYFTHVSRPIKLVAEAAESGNFSMLERDPDGELGRITNSLKALNDRLNRYVRENDEMARREQQSTMRYLESQLNPHFLRNTLSKISLKALSAGQNEIADSIYELSDVLQYALDVRTHFVYLYQDLDRLTHYVDIMNEQMSQKTSLFYEIEPHLYNCIVPKMLLQPFVENSILHGFRDKDSSGIIRVRATMAGDSEVELFVEDNGNGMRSEDMESMLKDSAGSHIGLSNANQRIKLLYGEGYGVDLYHAAFMTVHVRIPYITEVPEDPSTAL